MPAKKDGVFTIMIKDTQIPNVDKKEIAKVYPKVKIVYDETNERQYSDSNRGVVTYFREDYIDLHVRRGEALEKKGGHGGLVEGPNLKFKDRFYSHGAQVLVEHIRGLSPAVRQTVRFVIAPDFKEPELTIAPKDLRKAILTSAQLKILEYQLKTYRPNIIVSSVAPVSLNPKGVGLDGIDKDFTQNLVHYTSLYKRYGTVYVEAIRNKSDIPTPYQINPYTYIKDNNNMLFVANKRDTQPVDPAKVENIILTDPSKGGLRRGNSFTTPQFSSWIVNAVVAQANKNGGRLNKGEKLAAKFILSSLFKDLAGLKTYKSKRELRVRIMKKATKLHKEFLEANKKAKNTPVIIEDEENQGLTDSKLNTQVSTK